MEDLDAPQPVRERKTARKSRGLRFYNSNQSAKSKPKKRSRPKNRPVATACRNTSIN
jgi:hypothetical protein